MSKTKRESLIKKEKVDTKIINKELIPDLIKLIEQEKAKEQELELQSPPSGAMGGAVTIVNSVNKGGDSTTNMTSTSESLVNNALTGTPDFVSVP